MKDNKFIFGSIATDLKRVSMFLINESTDTALRFEQSAVKLANLVDAETVDSYGNDLLKRMEDSLKQKNREKKAENALMYSNLLQNYCKKYL